jgi:hypothetical protein
MYKLFLSIFLILIFSGCSFTKKNLKIDDSFQKTEQIQEKKQIELIKSISDEEEKKTTPKIHIYNDSVKSIIKKLTKITKIPYILVGNDLELVDSIFKITSIEDLEYYLIATSNYRLHAIDKYNSSRIKKFRIIKKHSNSIFENKIDIDVENEVKPIKIFNDISKTTKYTIISRPDVSDLLNKKQTINFTGSSYKDFIDFFKNKYDVYIEVNDYEKLITIQKYKMETITINIITDTIGQDKKDLTKDLEQSLNGISEINNR